MGLPDSFLRSIFPCVISTYFQRWPCPPWCSEGGARGRCRKGRYWGESFVSNNATIVFVPEEEGDWRREVDVVKVKLDLLSGDFPDESCSGAAEGKNPDVEEHQEKHVFLRWRARWIWSLVSIVFVVIWHFYICARNRRFISWNRISFINSFSPRQISNPTHPTFSFECSISCNYDLKQRQRQTRTQKQTQKQTQKHKDRHKDTPLG